MREPIKVFIFDLFKKLASCSAVRGGRGEWSARGSREISFECLDRKSVSRCTQWNLQCPGKPAHTQPHAIIHAHAHTHTHMGTEGVGMRSLAAITTRERAQKPECKTNGRRPQDADEVQRRQDKGHNHKLTLGHTHAHTPTHTRVHPQAHSGSKQSVRAAMRAAGKFFVRFPLDLIRFDSIRIPSNNRIEEGQSALF